MVCVWCAVPIREAAFNHDGGAWVVMWEDWHSAKGMRTSWTIRQRVDGELETVACGRWTKERGVYDVSGERAEDRKLIDVAFAQFERATVHPPMAFNGCCTGVVRSKNGKLSGKWCRACKARRANNRRVRQEVIARVKRLFDFTIYNRDEPVPHLPDGTYRGRRKVERTK